MGQAQLRAIVSYTGEGIVAHQQRPIEVGQLAEGCQVRRCREKGKS
jgi:hypothetical protein